MTTQSRIILFTCLLASRLVIVGAGCATAPTQKTPLNVIIAGSLMIPFDALEKAYEAEHPDVDIQIEAHGNYSATNVIASDFCEAIPNIVVPELLRGDCFVAKNAPRNDT